MRNNELDLEDFWKVETVETGSVFWLLRHWFYEARGGGCIEETLGSTALLSFKPPDISFALVCISLSLRMCCLFFDDLESDQRGKHYVVKLTDAKSRLIGKDSDAGKDWGKEERGWQRMRGWMASLTQWTRVGANSGREWKTGKHCSQVLQSMGSQRIGNNLVTEQQMVQRQTWPWADFLCTDFPF